MIEEQIDSLLSAAAPVTDEQIRSAGPLLGAAASELRDEVAATPHPLAPAPPVRHPARWGRRLGAIAAAIAVFAGAFVVLGTRGDDDGTAWAAQEVAFAEASPLVLLEGATVTRADQQPGYGGEMTFSVGGREVDLGWWTGSAEERLDGLGLGRGEMEVVSSVAALGTDIQVVRYLDPASRQEYRAVWGVGDEALELSATSPGDEDFLGLVHALRQVDADAWLSALPVSTVKAIDRTQVVGEMLADMQVPDGFDSSALTADAQVRDRYQLGAQVSGAVACAWLDRWDAAKAAGDQPVMDQASAAMAGSHQWKVLAEMDAEGDYPEVLWEVADSMAAGQPATAGGKGPGTGAADAALGCEDR